MVVRAAPAAAAVPRPRRPRAAPGAPVVVRRRWEGRPAGGGARGVRDPAAVGAGGVAAGVLVVVCKITVSDGRLARRRARLVSSWPRICCSRRLAGGHNPRAFVVGCGTENAPRGPRRLLEHRHGLVADRRAWPWGTISAPGEDCL